MARQLRNIWRVTVVALAISCFGAVPASAGLIGHWKLDDGAGTTATDSSVTEAFRTRVAWPIRVTREPTRKQAYETRRFCAARRPRARARYTGLSRTSRDRRCALTDVVVRTCWPSNPGVE